MAVGHIHQSTTGEYPSDIGSFLAIMLWAYYAMIVLLFGAEVVRAVQLERLAAAKDERDSRREGQATK